MKVQSNRIKANRKPASTENQDSRGVDKEIKQEPDQSAAPEIETPETLAGRGWKRLTLPFDVVQEKGGDVGDVEIMEDAVGELWLVTDYSGPHSSQSYRVDRRRISRHEARAMIARTCIPEAFREDFTQPPATTGHAAPFVELESCVYQANTLLFFLGNELGREFEEGWEGGKGGALAAGLVNLCHTTADALTLAFNESHKEWRRGAHPGKEDAA